MIAIECNNIQKSYGMGEAVVHALRGVTMQIHTGELLMLVGPSGCGKTTLLSIISGILNQDEGSCSLFGKEILQMPEAGKTEFRGQNVGFVFQNFNLIPTLSATENVAVPLMIEGIDEKEALTRARELLLSVGLDHRIDAHPGEMSGGEQQRVAICRSCIHSPRLIVCDEPTSALDEKTGCLIMEIFKEMTVDKECAVIVVTHDARILSFADRILKMNDGRILLEEKNSHA